MAAPLRGLLSIGVGPLWLQNAVEARCASVGVACADFRQCLDLLDLRTAARISEAAKPCLGKIATGCAVLLQMFITSLLGVSVWPEPVWTQCAKAFKTVLLAH